MYIPSERADAYKYPNISSEDKMQEWGTRIGCENPHLQTACDVINPSCMPTQHLQKKKIVGRNKLMGCDHAHHPYEGDFSRPIYIPSERVDANSYSNILAEGNRYEWDTRTYCNNQCHHTEGDYINENYIPSQQASACCHPFEPVEQMEHCTHGMYAKNTRFLGECGFKHPCQHEPSGEWELGNCAMAGERFAADPQAWRRPVENMGISEMPLDYLLELVDRAWRGEAIEEVEILLDCVYEDMREETGNEWLCEQPDPVVREELLLRLTDIIIQEMRQQQQREYYAQKTTPSRQYFGPTSPGCNCSCHTGFQMHSSENVNRMDYGDAWDGGDRTHYCHTHCRKGNISSMEEMNQYQRRNGYVEGKVAGESQPRGKERGWTAEMAADLHEYEAMARELQSLEKKRKSLIRSYNEGSRLNTQAQFVKIPHRRELDDITRKINMIKTQLNQMQKYYELDFQKPAPSRQPLRQYY
ncbi:uncharacterized protein LOC124153866 [Ischnura elegans]|uniref:uncharacterized protein LOC124153866 n=1 Tax=Ischnura elegans TaxID=197161 RepID=UPI001ED8A9AA|nr:uncharacterized protein LOC124153866 [Ischnura elegans]